VAQQEGQQYPFEQSCVGRFLMTPPAMNVTILDVQELPYCTALGIGLGVSTTSHHFKCMDASFIGFFSFIINGNVL
jgi:hypothetical protein